MLGSQKERELLSRLREAVINFDEEAVVETAKECIERGMDATRAIFEGLVPGIEEVGRLYEEEIYFIPEMLLCADALYRGLELLREHVVKKDVGVRGRVLIGVVEGDIHDIGKNIVKMMFEASSFEVYDLGRDVPLETFIREYRRLKPDLVCLSAMMTTTMLRMKPLIARLKEENPQVRIMVGGAPVTEHVAARWGAHGYAPNAPRALKAAIDLLVAVRNHLAGRTAG
ncbi:corrinoid protein of di/trimethylamine methyltransferase [Desulfofundulus luciae]|uniref:Corrinoid protein of di/trimethylamine methyltransferase n=1 Tax=Desulfofundulus luciae TaxID=74702 RepID=A0ABU0AXL5_9FIRM|nr:corrinoid protein [Desulfofundulus luciae]MDQ0285230.1 corrinoid protein of di/trimethylamine methyltransferase [Desulfofundulus luciae]